MKKPIEITTHQIRNIVKEQKRLSEMIQDYAYSIDNALDERPDIQGMIKHTDLFPWYWISYGEKCYAFEVVEAFPANENDRYPKPGTQLYYNDECKVQDEDGVEMMVNKSITTIEEQCGDVVCKFIAEAHTYLLGKEISKLIKGKKL